MANLVKSGSFNDDPKIAKKISFGGLRPNDSSPADMIFLPGGLQSQGFVGQPGGGLSGGVKNGGGGQRLPLRKLTPKTKSSNKISFLIATTRTRCLESQLALEFEHAPGNKDILLCCTRPEMDGLKRL